MLDINLPKFKSYKVYDTATGKYRKQGGGWSKLGRTWNNIGHVKLALTQDAHGFQLDAQRKQIDEMMRAEGVTITDYYGYVSYGRDHGINYGKYETDTVEQKQAMFRYLPETWIVIELTPEGAKQYCLARELWDERN